MKLVNKSALLLSTVLVGFTPLANAQVLDDTDTDVVDLREEELLEELVEGDGVSEIIVTGSRIRRTDLATAFPTLVVGQEILDKNAFTNIADALGQIPAFGPGIDPNGDQGANIGVNFVDFLNIGTQRTLTLVNGRRFVSSNAAGTGQQVDFNVFPVGLVERIETIGVGGAPTYGTDAIAGTINVILRDDYEGLEGGIQYGETERGDFDTQQYYFLAGANTEDGRGNVTFNIEYTDNDGALNTDRPEIFFNAPFTSPVPQGTDGFDDVLVPEGFRTEGRNGVPFTLDADGDGIVDNVERAFNFNGSGSPQNVQLFTSGGVISPGRLFIPSLGLGSFGDAGFFGFDPAGNLIELEAGNTIPGTSVFFAEGGFDNQFFGNVDQIQSPVERLNVGSTFKYDISNVVQFKGDFQFNNSIASELVEQGGFQTFAFDGQFNDEIAGALQIPASNPFLSPQARGVLGDLGITGDETFFFSRFNNDLLGAGRREAESSLWRISGGFQGDFDIGERSFYWDVSAVAGQSNIETQNTLLNDQRFLNAIDAVALTQDDVSQINSNLQSGNARISAPIGNVGDIVCAVTRDFARGDVPLDQIPGIAVGSGVNSADPANDVISCSPLNIFGEGVASPEAIDYVTQRGIRTVDTDQTVFTANFGGELVELPGGAVQFNVGYETRDESLFIATGAGLEVGLGRNAAQADTSGEFTTNEIYGELLVPLVSEDLDVPFVNRLEVGGQVRDIKNDVTDDFTAWTVEGTYQPLEDLTLRGNITRSLRAPSIVELFLSPTASFQFAADPCDDRFINQGDNRIENCVALGVRQLDANGNLESGFLSNVVNATVQGTTQGLATLTNETAEAWTVGGVLQPRWVPGLTIQADYINLEIEGLISAFDLEDSLEACFDAEPGALPVDICNSFVRDSGGQIINFSSTQQNADVGDFQFLQLRADYDFDIADAVNLFGNSSVNDYGSFSVDLSAFHEIQRDIVNTTGVPDPNSTGGFANPRWSGTADFTWEKSGLRLFWRTIWQDRTLLFANGDEIFVDDDGDIIESLSGNFLHNASIAYDLSEAVDYDKPMVLQININNVFDDDPGQSLRRVFGDFYASEILGRSYSLRVRAAF